MSILCDWIGVGCSNSETNSQHTLTADLTRYIDVPDSGWLLVLNDAGVKVSLCAYTKITLLKQKAGRTYFKVMDGPHYGMTASLKNENAERYITMTSPSRSGAVIMVRYSKLAKQWYSSIRNEYIDQQMADVSFNGLTAQATLNSDWSSGYTPIPAGTYNILIPDNPHNADYTSFYRQHERNLQYDQVWFPIEFGDNSRYIHVGHISHGCVTLHDLPNWNTLYNYLISHRATGRQYVGKLIVSL